MTDRTEPQPTDGRTVHQRMADALADLSHIPKQRSAGVSYTFRSIDALFDVLHPVLAKHGLFAAPKVHDDWAVQPIPGKDARTQYQATFRVSVVMWGAGGDSVELGPGLAQSHDYGDKAVYQAQQNAVKYVLLEAFCIPVNEPDMDAREADHSDRFDLGAYVAEKLDQFDGWDRDRARAEWVKALDGGTVPRSPEAADVVLARMRAAHAAENPDRAVPDPVDEQVDVSQPTLDEQDGKGTTE